MCFKVSHNDYTIRATTSETFKLVEKAQPKKSRTKYTKEQVIARPHYSYIQTSLITKSKFLTSIKIDLLETAYCVNPYPDLITVEHLCKTLGICKEKINVSNFNCELK